MSDISKLQLNNAEYDVNDASTREMIADEYVYTKTYNAGQLVIYNGVLYEAIKNVTTKYNSFTGRTFEAGDLDDEGKEIPSDTKYRLVGTMPVDEDITYQYTSNSFKVVGYHCYDKAGDWLGYKAFETVKFISIQKPAGVESDVYFIKLIVVALDDVTPIMNDFVMIHTRTEGEWHEEEWNKTKIIEAINETKDIALTIAPSIRTIKTLKPNTLYAGTDGKVYRYNGPTQTPMQSVTTGAEELKKIPELLVDEYSATETYDIHQIVMHEGKIYRCIYKIDTAEAFTAAHWEQTNIGNELQNRPTKKDFNAADTCLGFKDLKLVSTIDNRKLVEDGYAVLDSNSHILVYEVIPETVVYVRVSQDQKALGIASAYQFSATQIISSATRIGNTIISEMNTSAVVPAKAYYLALSQYKYNINNSVKYISLNTAVEAAKTTEHNIESWQRISRLVKTGEAHKYFAIGDQLTTTWTDQSLTPHCTYEVPMDIVSFQNVQLENGSVVPGMILQWHYSVPYDGGNAISFDNNQAFYYARNGLPAGTYYITIGYTWGRANAGDILQFTTTKDLPAGGVLAGLKNINHSYGQITGWNSTTSTSSLFSVQPTVVSSSSGISLGVLKNEVDSELNNIQEVAYGHNRYHTSAIRQWLNSKKDSFEWWAPQDNYDMMPDVYYYNGFMSGFNDEAFLDAIATTKIKTAKNYISDSAVSSGEPEYDVSCDKFFLPSARQMCGTNDTIAQSYQNGEGEQWQYWKDRTGLSSPSNENNTNRIAYNVKNKNREVCVRLRSANRTDAYRTYMINDNGKCVLDYSVNLNGTACCPVCVIA